MRLSDGVGGGRLLSDFVDRHDRLRYFSSNKFRIGFASDGVSYYLMQVIFTKAGSIWVQAPNFRLSDGMLDRPRVTQDGGRRTVSFGDMRHQASHLVKLHHPLDGRAHFSQDGRIINRVGRAAAFPLDGPMGKFCRLHAFLPVLGFKPFAERQLADATPTLIPPARRVPASVTVHLEWRRKDDVSNWASRGDHVGPRERLPSRETGNLIMMRFFGAPRTFDTLQGHVLMMFMQGTALPVGVSQPSMLLEGGFDADEVDQTGDPAPPPDSELAWLYPRPDGSDDLPSVDYVVNDDDQVTEIMDEPAGAAE